MSPRECYRNLWDLVKNGVAAVTATVVGTRGSTPRETGAKMLVHGDGTIEGTIGGGCGEAEVIEKALEMLKSGEGDSKTLVKVDLTEDIWEGADRICGGMMDVFLESWKRPSEELKTLASGEDRKGLVRLVPLDRTGGKEKSERVYSGNAAARFEPPLRDRCEQAIRDRMSLTGEVEGGEGAIFFEYVTGSATVFIFGAGHIAVPLARLAKMLDYQVAVIDDRPSFASRERFPEADPVLGKPYGKALGEIEIREDSIIILVTRGHRHDEYCLRRLLDTPAAYIGMLGSRRRVRAVFSSMLRDGFAKEKLERVFAPVGIDLQAQTPAEIAVSIMAELISLRRGGSVPHLREGLRMPAEKPL